MTEKVFIKNSKGLKLASIIEYPDKNGQYPAVIILHGFTGYKEEGHLAELAKTLVQNGFATVRFDCSGSGDSDGTFEKNYSMSNYLKDIECVYDYLCKLEFVNKQKISVLGHSMGGLLSIIFASLHQEIKICVAISSPTILADTDWLRGAIERWQELGWFYKKLSRDGKDIRIPFSFVTDANKFDAIKSVQKLHCPFLTVLGLNDDVVSPADSRKIFKAASEPKELAEIQGIGHDYKKDPKAIQTVNKAILDFFKKYL
jgi:uncharacterized protein